MRLNSVLFAIIGLNCSLELAYSSRAEEPTPPLVARVENGAYVPFSDSLNFIQKHPKIVGKFPKFKKIIFKECDKTKNPLKEPALTAAGWWDEWVKQGYQSLHQISDEFLSGDFSHDQGLLLNVMTDEARPTNPYELSRYIAPLALMQSFASHGELDQLKKMSKSVLAKVEDDLIQSKPKSPFWFGGNWTEAQMSDVKSLFPKLFLKSQNECTSYLKDENKDPDHVAPYGCKEMVRLLVLKKPPSSP
jgi:hypothetical protein